MTIGNSERLPVIDHLSYSSVNTYQRCPLQWHFRYVEKIPEEVIGSALVFGSAIHSGIERHFQTLLETGKAPTTEQLLEAFDECWTSFDTDLIKFGKGDDTQTMRELAKKMFTTFQASHFANPKGTIVAVEESMRAEFITGVPDVLARVDLAVQSGDELVLTDFKTSRSRWSADQAQNQAEQLLLYADLAGRVLDGKQIKLQFAVVTKSKTPVLEVHEVEFDESKLDRTKAIFSRVWDAIKSGNIYPAPTPMNCFSCGYQTACQAWRG
jgi:putative RecB family exonuclease